MVRIPLRNRQGETIAHALVDDEDAEQVAGRWHLSGGYVCRGRDDARLHRLLVGLADDDPREVDHKNRDRLDNRRGNLRVATRAQNMQNRPSYKGSSSCYRGVSWCSPRNMWAARVSIAGRLYHLGYFADEVEAAEAARDYRLKHMPFTVETLS